MINSTSHLNKESYKRIYDLVISRLYDGALKVGLTPFGERILREAVYYNSAPYIKEDHNILDLCCGTGTLTTILAKLYYPSCNLVGVDLSPGQIIQARLKSKNLPNLRFLVMDAQNLQFQKDSFNLVIISAALHEMNAPERRNVLNEVNRVLRKDGILIIFDHHEPSKTIIRLVYNLYLGFWEKLLSKSFEMQRAIFYELKQTKFIPISQIRISKFLNFFQIIINKKKI